MTTPPRWDLSNVYPSLESREFESALTTVQGQIDGLEKLFAKKVAKMDAKTPVKELAAVAGKAIDGFNDLSVTAGTVRAYIQSFVTTDSHNTLAMKKMSEFQMVGVRMQNLGNQFQAWVGKLAPVLEKVIKADPTARAHAFSLRDTADQSKYMMSAEEEALAAELSLSGASAWSKLQGTVTSQLTVDFELDGKIQTLPMPALINLHSHPDESVRRRAYEAEMAAWKTVEEPLAACMNGVKGTANTLNHHRGRTDALHPAIDMARIDRQTLEAMLGAMEASFPTFRSYFKAKAKRFGKEKLAWWDIFAPVGETEKKYTFDEARDFIITNFGKFSPELAAFAKRAFDQRWIDAEQREGKRGGAFCMGVPGVKESRVLCNFDGTLDQVSTIAHELGHAFHNECAYQAGKTEIQQDTPMTLAETASIMCETVVMEAVLAETTDPQEQLAIIETQLIGDAQVIMDIYYPLPVRKGGLRAPGKIRAFGRGPVRDHGTGPEKRLRRWRGRKIPAQVHVDLEAALLLCRTCRSTTSPTPSACLFGTGLYAIYQQRGAAFVPDYKALLASTGEACAADLAARFGIDIRSRKFWEDSLGVIARRVDRYCKL